METNHRKVPALRSRALMRSSRSVVDPSVGLKPFSNRYPGARKRCSPGHSWCRAVPFFLTKSSEALCESCSAPPICECGLQGTTPASAGSNAPLCSIELWSVLMQETQCTGLQCSCKKIEILLSASKMEAKCLRRFVFVFFFNPCRSRLYTVLEKDEMNRRVYFFGIQDAAGRIFVYIYFIVATARAFE